MSSIAERYQRLRAAVPPEVTIVLAAKRRTAEEVRQALDAGATDFGHNYVQEAAALIADLGEDATRGRWHMIGHLQKNKINQALPLFHTVQTVDSLKSAQDLSNRVERAGKAILPILLEINVAGEASKAGIHPEAHAPFADFLQQLVRDIAALPHLRLDGLMTMGPPRTEPEGMRPYFRQVKEWLDLGRVLALPTAPMTQLSMGMSSSYAVAIEEGATMIRVGSLVFGPRST
ncbi:MAG: YggS family pyridoxal phosphate-dependent enzyme [Phycisphaerales bacterium JB038]